MGNRLLGRIRVFLLTLLLALGMSLSFVQGGLMAAEMAVSPHAGAAGSSGCDECGGDGKIDVGMCLSVCGSAAQGMPPGELVAALPTSRTSFELASLALGGRSYSPDHGPPRIVTLG